MKNLILSEPELKLVVYHNKKTITLKLINGDKLKFIDSEDQEYIISQIFIRKNNDVVFLIYEHPVLNPYNKHIIVKLLEIILPSEGEVEEIEI